MESFAAEDSAVLFRDDEISNVFAQFGDAPRKQRTFVDVWLDNCVNMLYIW
ncbi:MAG TPA: hypothetical protein VNE63_19760 [Candidatus Acidoferrales bacterium]|nr:hypothetical protein [Candidatus Acidoferrales bacterium]